MKLVFLFLLVFTAFFGMTGGSITITVTRTAAETAAAIAAETAAAIAAETAAAAATTVALTAAETAALTAAQQAHRLALNEASYTAALHRAAIAAATDQSVIQTAAAAAARAAVTERAAAVAVEVARQGLQICSRSGFCTGGAAGTSSVTAAVAAAQAATAKAATATAEAAAASSAATSSSSALSSSLQYVGPVVTIIVTAPTVINDLQQGNVAAATGHTAVAAASYQAAASGAAACAPFYPPFGPILCAAVAGATTSILGNIAVDATTMPAIPHPTPAAAPILTPLVIADRLTDILNIEPPPLPDGRPGNRFQPSHFQVDRLRAEIDAGHLPRFNTLTNTQWLEALEGRGQGTDNPLFDGLRIDEIEDQLLRAESIAREMIRLNENRVTLLDGHGRIIFLVLRALRDLSPVMVDRARFTIIDITHSVDQWHRIFLPASTTCFEGDFFGDINRLTGIVYVNFCSIGTFAGAFVQTIRELSLLGQTVFVSYSTRGINTDGRMALISESMALHRALATMDRRSREQHPILGARARRESHGTTSSAVLTDSLRASIANIRDGFTPIGWEIFRRNPDRGRNAHDGRGNFITYILFPTSAAFSASLGPT